MGARVVLLAAALLFLAPQPAGAQPEEQLFSDLRAQALAAAAVPADPIARLHWVQWIVFDAAARWDVPYSVAWRVALCESGGDPFARSPWGHRGLFQFSAATWREYAPRFGVPADFAAAYDPAHNAQLALAMIAGGGLRHWRSCAEWI